jgi:DNA-binding IclR family transcriptional regulator/transposase
MNRSPHTWKEARRLQAWLLRPHGWSPRQMAEALGVSEGAVSQWMTRARQGDAEALRHRRPPGAPCRLTAGPLARLPTLVHQAPEAYGVRGEVWTRSRMAAVIRLECGVTYPPAHVSRVCQAMRWSPQKPARRARQRDDVAIAHWRDETWSAINKGHKRRSGLMDLACPLMHAVSDAHGVSVYLSKVLGPSSLLLLDWVGAAFRTDLSVTVGRQYPGPAGASGVIMGAFGSGNETELEALFSEVAWYRKPSFADFLARAREARQCGFAVDRGTMFQGITQVSVPVLSPSWELLLVLTAAGHAHDFDGDAVGPLSRAMQSAAARLSESVRLLRLG